MIQLQTDYTKKCWATKYTPIFLVQPLPLSPPYPLPYLPYPDTFTKTLLQLPQRKQTLLFSCCLSHL
jgi:hypothetical protein